MFRSLVGFCLGLAVLHAAQAASSTVYAAYPYTVVAPTSTSTFKSPGIIPTPSPGSYYMLSPDGKTLYYTNGGSLSNGPIVAMDMATGATVQTFTTEYLIMTGRFGSPDGFLVTNLIAVSSTWEAVEEA